MTELSNDDKKWFESLKRCLKKKPNGVKILVHELANTPVLLCSEIHMFKTGDIHKSQHEVDDLMMYDPSDYSVEHFEADGVAANNHGY